MKLNEPVYGVLSSEKKIRVIKYLLKDNDVPEASERSLARLLKISNVSVNRTMNELEKLNMVRSRFIGGAKVWSVNRKSHTYSILKKLMMPETGEFLPVESLKKTLIKELKKLPVIKAVLFGSIARGDEKANSDIDLFVLVKGNADKIRVEKAMRDLDDTLGSEYGNKMGDYILTEKEYAEKAGLAVIKNIEKEGLKLI